MDIYVKLFGKVPVGAEYHKHTILIKTDCISESGNTVGPPPPSHLCIHGAHIPMGPASVDTEARLYVLQSCWVFIPTDRGPNAWPIAHTQ